MLFNTLNFIIFFVAVVVTYYLLPKNSWRKVFLLGASYYFYACFNVTMLAVLLFETALAYWFGLSKNKIKTSLTTTIVILLLPLLCLKYLNFLMGTVGDVLALSGALVEMPSFELLLPIGISFYTFMAVGYVVDVYKGKIEAEKNLLDFALFVGFFPQIASGPIGRAGQLIPQLKEKQPLLYANITAGAKMMLWGYFMKLVVGDRAGIYVDTVFGNYAHHNGASLLLATFMYTIQIYCDFAGYSLIAIGCAKMMGIELMENFRRPYFATSVADFWRKWHISLSTWFRDYVYFPCGGSRCSKLKTYRNLMITFLVSGLWHGAAYNFILWGIYHGANQVFGKVLQPMKDTCRKVLHIGDTSIVRKVWDICLTFCLIAYGWMLFYAPDMQFIVDVTKGYVHLGTPYIHQTTIFFFAIGFALLLLKDFKDEFYAEKVASIKEKHPKFSICWNYVKFAALAILIVWIGVLGGGQFIYFKF
ncbi:MAG: MBOAT family protein [Bacteroidaceae bacterium]|nr:MBOAT family protein [Bacteroidaceae bacterium]